MAGSWRPRMAASRTRSALSRALAAGQVRRTANGSGGSSRAGQGLRDRSFTARAGPAPLSGSGACWRSRPRRAMSSPTKSTAEIRELDLANSGLPLDAAPSVHHRTAAKPRSGQAALFVPVSGPRMSTRRRSPSGGRTRFTFPSDDQDGVDVGLHHRGHPGDPGDGGPGRSGERLAHR